MKKPCKLTLKREVIEMLGNKSMNHLGGGQRLPDEMTNPFPMKTILCDTSPCVETEGCMPTNYKCETLNDCPTTRCTEL